MTTTTIILLKPLPWALEIRLKETKLLEKTMSSGNVTIMNRFILGFLKLNGASDDMIEMWKTKDNQSRFKSSITKMRVNHVKRGKTVYICFCDEERPLIFKEFPEMNIKDVTCELARRWHKFKENTDKERLDRLTRLSEESNNKYYASKQIINSVHPPKKHVNSSYLNFCKKQRESTPKITMKELGAKWREAKESGEDKKYAITAN
jgi:hypothetical protein